MQNFNENIGVLVMLAFYALLVFAGLSTNAVILLFGLMVTGVMVLVMWRHRINLASGDQLHLVTVRQAEPNPR